MKIVLQVKKGSAYISKEDSAPPNFKVNISETQKSFYFIILRSHVNVRFVFKQFSGFYTFVKESEHSYLFDPMSCQFYHYPYILSGRYKYMKLAYPVFPNCKNLRLNNSASEMKTKRKSKLSWKQRIIKKQTIRTYVTQRKQFCEEHL